MLRARRGADFSAQRCPVAWLSRRSSHDSLGHYPCQIAFRQPSIFRRLTYELEVVPVLNVFTKDYLSQNYGITGISSETARPLQRLGTVGRRLVLSPPRMVLFRCWALLVCCLCNAPICPVAGLRRRVLLLCLPLGAFSLFLSPGHRSALLQSRAFWRKTRGRNQEAID